MRPDLLKDPARLAAVARSGLVGTAPEEPFDRLAGLARELLEAPYAFVTLVDADRSHWKSRLGEDLDPAVAGTTVDASFCQYVITEDGPLLLGDTRRDPRTRDNPSIASMGVVAWAGYPLRSPDGLVLGSFCVIDTRPRSWTARDAHVLDVLARAASSEVALRMRLSRADHGWRQARRGQQDAERDAAHAVAHAADSHHVALVLQESMLSHPVQPDHLEIAVRYRPAATDHQVGGDWYDAFQQPDGACVLVIGDVVGHDITAAAAMGQLRNLLRATAYGRDEPPSRVLSRVDEAVRGLDVGAAATVLVGRVERPDGPADATRRLRWSSAGHLPPLLLLRDGTVRTLTTPPDLLLGVEPGTPRHDHTMVLPEGSTLLLYTDGLVEERDRSLAEGMAALGRNLSRLGGLSLEDLCDEVLAAMLPPAPGDDVAVLALRAHPEAGSPPATSPQPEQESTR